jgi:hypothetical protein
MPTVLVHVRANAAGAIRREKRNGRDVIIVPSATLPDDVVMNDVLYPADEIAKSYKGLERKPAPLGHPTINGKFVSASDPEGLNLGWIGAWNENVRQEKMKGGKNRVLLDKVIDVERANQSEGGKRVLAAIEKGEPVHTSNALYAEFEAANGDVPYKHIARNMEWDHDAILLDQPGAATPEQGVGMLVNSAGQAEEIEVINSCLEDGLDQEIDWAGTRLVEAVRRKADASKWQELKDSILKALGLASERSTSTNQKEDDVTDKAQFDALSAKVDALSEAIKPEALAQVIGNAVSAAMKPLNDQLAANAASEKAKEDAERATLTDKVIKANLLDEEGAKEASLSVLRKLAGNIKAEGAAPLNPLFKGNTEGQQPAFKLPKAEG